MIKETVLSRSLRLMFSGGVAMSLSVLTQAAMAQEAAPANGAMQRVEVTGSSIKRIVAEGALPVQTLTRAQIDQSGASSVADLVAALPSMQGFTTSSQSVNGGGGGIQTASIHGIGEGYTLVLLNGRRMAPATSGSTVNLASIPLSAVERVEILTDGASTLYGSDAIAGVVNFILKKNQTDLHIEGTYNSPLAFGGGKSGNIGISKGWGDLETDGFNILLSAAHDEQTALYVKDRAFSSSGVVPFSQNGQTYTLYQLSSNSSPGNATVKYKNGAGVAKSAAFGPDFLATGKCNGPSLFNVGNRCLFDYASTVEATPELKRDSLFASGNFKLNQDTRFFVEAVASKFTNTAAFAPPAQPLGIPLNSALYNKSISPYLAQLGIDPNSVTSATMNLRLSDAGGRTDLFETQARHLAFGVEGTLKNWDYGTSYTHSENTATDTAGGGYMSLNKFQALVTAGTFDPFASPGNSKAILAPAVLHNKFDETVSKIDVVSAHASRELFQLPGGMAQLGIGGDFTKQQYKDSPDAYLQGTNQQQPNFTDAIVGGGAGALPVDASRKNYGTYAELLIPIIKKLDVTVATRYDHYSAVTNTSNFDANGNLIAPASQGNAAGKETYKLALRYSPTDTVLLRASYGTGFKVAAMTSIVKPLVNGGSSQFHACPITSTSDPRYPLCNPGSSEYTLLSGGNAMTGDAGLKPELSKQATVGFRIEPSANFSIGFDLWDVKLTNQIQTLSEDTVFGNPALYDKLFSAYYDPIQKQNVLAAALTPFNLASSHFQGLDWDHTFKSATPLGKLNLNWTGTYMLKSEQEVPGTGVEKNIGRFNSYANVTFRVITKLTAALKTSDMFTHAVTMNYRSGYVDQVYTDDNTVVRIVNADGSLGAYVPLTRRVASYLTLDWQSKVALQKNLIVTVGVKNLMDRNPPMTMRNAGGGNQSGYDGRYTDPLGRQFYLVGSYKF